jgi:hypothetical protein
MTQLVLLWIALGVVTLALALYRKILGLRTDPYLHLSAGAQRHTPEQYAGFRRMSIVDRWGITLTIITAVLGIALAALYLWNALRLQ